MKIPLFDIDGTLVKAGSSINRDAFTYAVKKTYGIEAYQTEINPEGMVDNQILVEVLKLHGLNEIEIKQKLKEEIQAVSEYAKANINNVELEVLPGVKKLLVDLRNQDVPMGVLTGNVEGLAWTKLEVAGIRNFFEFGAFGSQAHVRSELVEIARINAEKALGKKFKISDFTIVGDTPKDIKCARDANIRVIAVASGIFPFEELAKDNPDLLIHTFEGKNGVIEFLKS